MGIESAEDLLIIICANLSVWTTILLNCIFFLYIIQKIIWIDFGFGPYFNKYIYQPIKRQLSREPEEWENAIKIRKRRFPPKRQYFFNRHIRILCVLQMFTVGSSLADAYTIFPVSTVAFFCYLQSIQMQVFNLLVFTWSSILALFMFYTIYFQYAAKNYTIFNWIMEISSHIIVWVVSILSAIPMLVTGTVGEAGGWCWVTNTNIQFLTFYIPLWILIVLNILLYTLVLLKIFITLRKSHLLKKSLQKEEHLKVVMKLILYPCIFIFIWTLPTIRRFLGFFGIGHVSLAIIHVFITPIQGGLNVIVYFLNPIGHLRLIRSIFCFPCIYLGRKSKSVDEKTGTSIMYQLEQLVRDEEDTLTATDNNLTLLDHEFESGSILDSPPEGSSYLMRVEADEEKFIKQNPGSLVMPDDDDIINDEDIYKL